MGKCRIKFIDLGTDIPVVRFFFDDGTESYAIVDSGSEQTLFNIEDVKQHSDSFKIDKVFDVRIAGMQAMSNMVTEAACTAMTFSVSDEESVCLETFGICVDISHINEFLKSRSVDIPDISVLFGADFLSKYGFKLNFKTREMTSNDLSCKQQD